MTLAHHGQPQLPHGASKQPITIAEQGSFFVGGRPVTAAGCYDEVSTARPSNAGQTYMIDGMYVQYQIPQNATRPPIVLMHGGGGSGRVWETTPDGREGYQTLLLRRGYPVYIVDAPRGGRSGVPSFNGAFGKLDDTQQVISDQTARPGREHCWTRWRMGPRYPEVFPNQAFPMAHFDEFMLAVRPQISDDPELCCESLIALFQRIGPAVLITHSLSGYWGWLAAARSTNIRAIVSYEPSVVFPKGEMPPPLPLYRGEQQQGLEISSREFQQLALTPIQVVYGDNIPTEPVPELTADNRRVQVSSARLFASELNKRGGKASVLMLPEVGLRGNSHFMFSDLNNIEVADQIDLFLRELSI